jgi:non-specific serine/threonine protein kinase
MQRLSSAFSVLTHGNPPPHGRHSSLRTALASSEELLSPPTRSLFRCLSVFAGGFDAETVEVICGKPLTTEPNAEPAKDMVLNGLSELLDHGLLRRDVVTGVPRFVMSKTIAAHAIETLHATGEADQVHSRHAIYFLMLAEEATPALVGEGQEWWLERLEADHENLRAALRWSLDHEPEMALRFVAALWRFWFVRGYLHEGKRWIERALTAAARAPTALGVRALNGLGVLVWAAGDPERALQVQNVCLARARESNNSWGVAVAQADRAFLEFVIYGEAGRARLLAEEALDQARSLGDRHLEGVALTTLGSIATSSGNLSDAALHFQDALAIAMENGDSASQEFRRFKLGQLARLTGDLERAAHLHLEALGIAERLNAQEDLLHILAGIAGIAVVKQDYDRAARLLAATSALSEKLDATLHPAEQARFDQDLAAVQDALPEATFLTAWEDGRGLSPAEAEKIARDLPESSGQCTSGNGLSRRELEVLQMLANGASDREIAEALFISTETASTHVKNIRRKFGVRSRSAAAACGIRRALI